MNGCIFFYCRTCKCDTNMEICDRVDNLRIYRLKCKKCRSEWRVPFDILEEQQDHIEQHEHMEIKR